MDEIPEIGEPDDDVIIHKLHAERSVYCLEDP